MPDLPVPSPPDARFDPQAYLAECFDLVERGDAEGNTIPKRLWTLFLSDEVDEKGKPVVPAGVQLLIAQHLSAEVAARKIRERDAGVSKLPDVRQTANVTQSFQMPRKLFESLTPEQKQLLVDEARTLAVPVAAEVR